MHATSSKSPHEFSAAERVVENVTKESIVGHHLMDLARECAGKVGVDAKLLTTECAQEVRSSIAKTFVKHATGEPVHDTELLRRALSAFADDRGAVASRLFDAYARIIAAQKTIQLGKLEDGQTKLFTFKEGKAVEHPVTKATVQKLFAAMRDHRELDAKSCILTAKIAAESVQRAAVQEAMEGFDALVE